MKSSTRAGLTLTVLMIALFALIGAVGANIGPVELMIWLVILVSGWALILYGARRSNRTQ